MRPICLLNARRQPRGGPYAAHRTTRRALAVLSSGMGAAPSVMHLVGKGGFHGGGATAKSSDCKGGFIVEPSA